MKTRYGPKNKRNTLPNRKYAQYLFAFPERSTEVGWTIIDRTERIIEPIELTTDGPGGAPAPPGPPPIVSAFGDTDGEFFGKNLQTAKKSRGWLGF